MSIEAGMNPPVSGCSLTNHRLLDLPLAAGHQRRNQSLAPRQRRRIC
ncbi:hypothetical protein OKW43_006828 [Paraburkholderia sp. WC7.3g]|nr:hypothetical protein [Paraburkholderia podalyriae]